jgi:ACS family tartrate transporter-like MFS transporter
VARLSHTSATCGPGAEENVGDRAIAAVRRRLLPFMFLLYIVSYLDRINVGFAALQMNADLHFNGAVYGLGAGIFFVGYFAFEIPSNLILHRVGARKWIARIMISWGITAGAMSLVRTPTTFYIMRFVLGLAEAGFFPGMLLYLSQWFPAKGKARAIALFMTATAVAGVIGGPLSGALLKLDGLVQLRGWQWLFLLEGAPAVVLGLVVLAYMTNTPAEAKWLGVQERTWLIACLDREHISKAVQQKSNARIALCSGQVWASSVLYFTIVMAMYGVGFWLPLIVKGLSGASDGTVALITALPYLSAVIVMVPVARHSDETGERRWHIAGSCVVAAVGLLATAATRSPILAIASLCVAASGMWSSLGPCWSLPMAVLSGEAAAAGLALINSVGNLGGFAGPYLVGLVRRTTNSFAAGLAILALGLLLGATIAVTFPKVVPLDLRPD